VRERRVEPLRWIPSALLPLIALAETFSWYTTLTANFLGSVVEESLWTLAATLVLLALLGLRSRSRGRWRALHGGSAALAAGYVAFMLLVDVPMYVARWRQDEARGTRYAPLVARPFEVPVRSVVTFRWEDWRAEIPWMTLYFSVGVWVSLALVRVPPSFASRGVDDSSLRTRPTAT
jgi:hypothetical protein